MFRLADRKPKDGQWVYIIRPSPWGQFGTAEYHETRAGHGYWRKRGEKIPALGNDHWRPLEGDE